MTNTRTTTCRRASRVPHRARAQAHTRRTAALAGLLAGGILLAGCSDSSNTTAPTPSDTASTSPSPNTTPTMTVYGTVEEQKRALPKSRDGMQTGAVMNRAVATNPEEEAVADAWLRYWQVRTKAFMDAKVDAAARDSAATGKAAKEITEFTSSRKKHKVYTHGAVILNPTRITIKDDTAILLDCMLDESRDIYSDGTMEQKGITSYGTRAVLKKSQGIWRTDSFLDNQKYCTNEGMEQG
jgi:hypothetical protein